ncbi:alpha/beta hydrolase [Tepidiforma sp.]|uniref:alpha/beta fold hydrolase n=1 Tax=Tepidiforma sp. TaxID=2682230 RepID=UPI002ADE231F|nr:alpha/beta hydrolase [Tepidiforma sp.]
MGSPLRYTDTGSGGPPLLFVHGLACDRRAWEPQLADLSRDHRCISVDLRGRGETPATPPYGMATAAADLAALLDDLGLERVVVIGHSLGGVIALLLNELVPERVMGVVAGDSPIYGEWKPGSSQLPARIREQGTAAGLGPMVESFFVEGTPEPVRQYVRGVMLSCPPDIAAGMLEDADEVFTRMEALVRLADSKPFMAIWAERPLGHPAWLRSVTRFARQEPVAGAGHFFQLERPDLTNALIRSFLDDVANDPRLAAR